VYLRNFYEAIGVRTGSRTIGVGCDVLNADVLLDQQYRARSLQGQEARLIKIIESKGMRSVWVDLKLQSYFRPIPRGLERGL
jgi:hypothetical protein